MGPQILQDDKTLNIGDIVQSGEVENPVVLENPEENTPVVLQNQEEDTLPILLEDQEEPNTPIILQNDEVENSIILEDDRVQQFVTLYEPTYLDYFLDVGKAGVKGVLSLIPNVLKSIGATADYLENIGVGPDLNKNLNDWTTYRLGTEMEHWLNELIPIYTNTLATETAGMLGVLADYFLMGLISGPGVFAIGTMDYTSSQYERAVMEGASKDEATSIYTLNIPVGVGMMVGINKIMGYAAGRVGSKYLPKLIPTSVTEKIPLEAIGEAPRAFINAGASGALTGAVITTSSNLIAKQVYDDSRDVFESVPRSSLVFALAGGITAGLGTVARNQLKEFLLNNPDIIKLEMADRYRRIMDFDGTKEDTPGGKKLDERDQAMFEVYTKLREKFPEMTDDQVLNTLFFIESISYANNIEPTKLLDSFNLQKMKNPRELYENFMANEVEYLGKDKETGKKRYRDKETGYEFTHDSELFSDFVQALAVRRVLGTKEGSKLVVTISKEKNKAKKKKAETKLDQLVALEKFKLRSSWEFGKKGKDAPKHIPLGDSPIDTPLMVEAVNKNTRVFLTRENPTPVDFFRALAAVSWDMLSSARKMYVKGVLRDSVKKEYGGTKNTQKLNDAALKKLFVDTYVSFLKGGKINNNVLESALYEISSLIKGFYSDNKGIFERTMNPKTQVMMETLLQKEFRNGTEVYLDYTNHPDKRINSKKGTQQHRLVKIISRGIKTRNEKGQFVNKEYGYLVEALEDFTILKKVKGKWVQDSKVLKGDQFYESDLYVRGKEEAVGHPEFRFSQFLGKSNIAKSALSFFTDIIYQASKGSPEFRNIVYEITYGDLVLRHELTQLNHRINDWYYRLRKAGWSRSRIKVSRKEGLIDDFFALSKEDYIRKHNEETYQIAKEIITTFQEYNGRIVQYLKEKYLRGLSKHQADALLELEKAPVEAFESSADFENYFDQIASKYHADADKLRKHWDKYKNIEQWGLDNYFPNIEFGSFIIADRDGVPRAFAKNKKAAKKKLRELERREGFKDLKIFTPEDIEYRAYINPFERRRNVLKGEDNIFDAIKHYGYHLFRTTVRQPHIDTATEMLKAHRHEIPKQQIRIAEKAIDDSMKSNTWAVTQALDDLFVKFGATPGVTTRAMGTIRKVTGVAKLGYRVGALLNNSIAGVINMLSYSTIPELKEAIKFLKTPEGERFMMEHEMLLGTDLAAQFDSTVKSKIREKLSPTYLFRLPESPMRKVMFTAAYRHSLKEQGTTHEEASASQKAQAIQDATLTNALVLFTYNTASLPEFMRSQEMRTILQFRSYLIKQAELFKSMNWKQRKKYFFYMMAFGGPRVAFSFAYTFPLIGMLFSLTNIDEWEQKSYDTLGPIHYGLPGFLGLDVSTGIALDFPNSVSNALGAFGSTMFYAGKLTWDKLMYDIPFENLVEDFGEHLSRYVIFANNWRDVLTTDGDGNVRHPGNGKLMYNLATPWERALVSAGISTIEKNRYYTIERAIRDDTIKEAKWKISMSRRLQRHLNSDSLTDEDIIYANYLGISIAGELSKYAHNTSLTPRERRALKMRSLKSLRQIEEKMKILER